MPWLLMTAQDAEAFDQDMLAKRVKAIRGNASRYSWPEETDTKGMVAVLIAPEHEMRLDVGTRSTLLGTKPVVVERAIVGLRARTVLP